MCGGTGLLALTHGCVCTRRLTAVAAGERALAKLSAQGAADAADAAADVRVACGALVLTEVVRAVGACSPV
jgi:hypothetical protein